MDRTALIERITREVLDGMKKDNIKEEGITVGISARHVHLSQEDLEVLFGQGYQLNVLKPLMGNEFAAKEMVTIVGPSLRAFENVRVLGPVRKRSQVEISRTDAFALKVNPPIRPSGVLDKSENIVVVGPKGTLFLKEGCIIANRHMHMTPADAAQYGLKDNDYVDIEIRSEKPSRFSGVQVRVSENFNTELHLDTDDGNATGLKNGDRVFIIKA